MESHQQFPSHPSAGMGSGGSELPGVPQQYGRMQQQPGAPPKRYVPPHLRKRSTAGTSTGTGGAAAAGGPIHVGEEVAAGAGYPEYPMSAGGGGPSPFAGGGGAQAPPPAAAAPAHNSSTAAPAAYHPRSSLANGYQRASPGIAPASEEAVAEHHSYGRGMRAGRGMNSTFCSSAGGEANSSHESSAAEAAGAAPGGGGKRIGGGLAALAAQQQQQMGGGKVFSSRAAALQQQHPQQHHIQSSGSAAAGRSMVPARPSITGTGWDVRDGRRYVPEKEREVFSSDKMQSTGIKFDSYDKVPVELKGRGAEMIVAIESFQTPGPQIHPLLLQNVAYVKYTKPTPIQKNSIPTILSGRDLMACAQTGSGKTAAFLFPIVARMLQAGPPPLPAARSSGEASAYRKATAYPVCLVLSPTRELAMQIYEEARKFQFGTGIRTVALYGGSDVKRQLFDLDGGCDICVATPGRLVDLLERRKVRLALVQFFVLDEADRMLDMGFLPQIKHIVEDFDLPPSPSAHQSPLAYPLLNQSAGGECGVSAGGRPAGRQTVMFSATFPREIQMLAKDFLEDYIYLAVGRVGSTNEFIRQRLQYADEDQKLKLLVKLLRDTEKGLTILFVETKRKADMIEGFLLEDNFPAVSIHGDRTQQEREEALRLFKAGKRPILVATDVAARGLDISNVTHVINFDLPTNIDDYVHRIGRTGRAGNLGLATSFVNESNKPILRDLMKLLEEAKQEIPSFLPPLVLSCTSSSARMGNFRSAAGGGWGSSGGGGRGGSASRSGGGGAFTSKTGGYGSSMGPRSGAMPMSDARLPASDWRTSGTGSRPMAGFSAAIVSGERGTGSTMDAW